MSRTIQEGINLIKNGDIPNGINILSEIYKENPFQKEIYINLGNAFLGAGDYESSMKCYLTYSHFIIENEKIDMDAYQEKAFLDYYNWNGKLNSTVTIMEDLHLFAVTQDFNISKIIANTTLTSNIGTAYLTRHQDIINYNSIGKELIMNDLRIILGRESQGESLRNSKYSALVRNIGLAFIMKNLLTSPELELNDIVSIYFSDNYTIEDL